MFFSLLLLTSFLDDRKVFFPEKFDNSKGRGRRGGALKSQWFSTYGLTTTDPKLGGLRDGPQGWMGHEVGRRILWGGHNVGRSTK